MLPTRGHPDIFDELRNLVPELHTAEQRSAKLVLSDPSWVAENSIKAFAKRAEVSEPTIMRLCRKLNLRGFTAFKRKLTEDLVIAKVYFEADQVVRSSSPTSIAETMFDAASQSLRETAARLDPDVLERAITLLGKAHMVYCFGVGGSSATIADEAVNRLFRLGVKAQSSADPYRQRMTASVVGPGEAFLLISSTGRPASIVESALLARSNGADVISITLANSPLAEHSTEVFAVEIFDDEAFFNLPSRIRYAQLYVLDCLVGTLATKLPGAAGNLKSIRSTLSSLHGIVKYQPAGD